MRGRRGQGGRVLPLRQLLPNLQRIVRRRRVGPAQRMHHVAAPAPAGLQHARRQHRPVAVQQRVPSRRQLVQQRGGDIGQPRHLRLQPDRRVVVVQRHRQTPGRRCRGPRAAGQRRTGQADRTPVPAACPAGGTSPAHAPGSAAAWRAASRQRQPSAAPAPRRPVSGWRLGHGPRPHTGRRAAQWKESLQPCSRISVVRQQQPSACRQPNRNEAGAAEPRAEFVSGNGRRRPDYRLSIRPTSLQISLKISPRISFSIPVPGA